MPAVDAVAVGAAAVDVATELLLLQLPGGEAVSDHGPLQLGDQRGLPTDELGHRAVAILLSDRDDAHAVAVNAALEHDERGVVARRGRCSGNRGRSYRVF
jgi:hypothetical protein